MKEILAAYEAARFKKSAQEPTTVPGAMPEAPAAPQQHALRGIEMNEAMRRVRDAIEQSMSDESRARAMAREFSEWGQTQVQTPAERGTAPLLTGVGAVGGAGALAETLRSRYAPNLREVHKAVGSVRGAMDEKKWNKLLTEMLGTAPKGKYRDIEFAQALMPESKAVQAIPGRGVDPEVIEKMRLTRVRGKAKAQPTAGFKGKKPPKVPRAKAQYRETPFWKALADKTKGTGGGRAALRSRLMTEAAKGKGIFARSPAVRGAAKSLGGAAGIYLLYSLLSRAFSDVAPATSEAERMAMGESRRADIINAWRQKQLEQLSGATRGEDVSVVPWAPYAEQLQE